MSDTQTNPAADIAAILDTSSPSAAKSGFNTHLSFYHANPKNTGCAIQFSVEPATPDRDGAAYFSIAKQKTVASNDGERRFASFDWANKITVKLNFIEVSELLLVLGGHLPAITHGGKDGLFHTSPTATTTISLKRTDDPAHPGFLLGVGRSPKADPNARQYYTFAFWPAEAFGLRAALTAQMGLLAFGVPRVRPPQPGTSFASVPADPFAPPPAPSASFAAPVPAMSGGFGTDF